MEVVSHSEQGAAGACLGMPTAVVGWELSYGKAMPSKAVVPRVTMQCETGSALSTNGCEVFPL